MRAVDPDVVAGLHPADESRLGQTLNTVRTANGQDLLAGLLPEGARTQGVADFFRCCRFEHAAVLVFPDDTSSVVSVLQREGLRIRSEVPSTVVRGRLAARYRMSEDRFDVWIIHGAVPGGTLREVEVFALPLRPGLEPVADDERVHDREAHVAFEVVDPDPVTVGGLWDMLTGVAGGAGIGEFGGGGVAGL